MSDKGQHHPAVIRTNVDDPELDEVKEEDRPLIKDVISVLSAMQQPARVCKGWSVKPKGTTHYEVTGYIDTKGGEWEVFYDDLDLIRKLDYARISPVSVRVSGLSAQVFVRVLSRTERVMLTECDIIRVQKRTRWFG
jgi:hypothetical protein